VGEGSRNWIEGRKALPKRKGTLRSKPAFRSGDKRLETAQFGEKQENSNLGKKKRLKQKKRVTFRLRLGAKRKEMGPKI